MRDSIHQAWEREVDDSSIWNAVGQGSGLCVQEYLFIQRETALPGETHPRTPCSLVMRALL